MNDRTFAMNDPLAQPRTSPSPHRSRGLLVFTCLLAWACSRPEPNPAAPVSTAPPAPSDHETPADPPSDAPDDGEPVEESAPPAATAQQDAESLLVVFEQLGSLHETHAQDCTTLASAIEAFAQENAEALANQPPAAHAWIDAHDDARARMRAAMEHVMTASMACRKNGDFKRVTAKLFAQEAPSAG